MPNNFIEKIQALKIEIESIVHSSTNGKREYILSELFLLPHQWEEAEKARLQETLTETVNVVVETIKNPAENSQEVTDFFRTILNSLQSRGDIPDVPCVEQDGITPIQELYKRVYSEHCMGSMLPDDQEDLVVLNHPTEKQNKLVLMPYNLSGAIVFGDLHGDYDSSQPLLIEAIIQHREKGMPYFVFLGDYVDRGEKDLETLMLVFILKHMFPEHVVLLTGNHENLITNKVDGHLKSELLKRQISRLKTEFFEDIDEKSETKAEDISLSQMYFHADALIRETKDASLIRKLTSYRTKTQLSFIEPLSNLQESVIDDILSIFKNLPLVALMSLDENRHQIWHFCHGTCGVTKTTIENHNKDMLVDCLIENACQAMWGDFVHHSNELHEFDASQRMGNTSLFCYGEKVCQFMSNLGCSQLFVGHLHLNDTLDMNTRDDKKLSVFWINSQNITPSYAENGNFYLDEMANAAVINTGEVEFMLPMDSTLELSNDSENSKENMKNRFERELEDYVKRRQHALNFPITEEHDEKSELLSGMHIPTTLGHSFQ